MLLRPYSDWPGGSRPVCRAGPQAPRQGSQPFCGSHPPHRCPALSSHHSNLPADPVFQPEAHALMNTHTHTHFRTHHEHTHSLQNTHTLTSEHTHTLTSEHTHSLQNTYTLTSDHIHTHTHTHTHTLPSEHIMNTITN